MMPTANTTEWRQFLEGYPDAHLLQTASWGELKTAFGWQVSRVIAGGSGAQILFRPVGLGLSLAYIPKGPVGGWPDMDSRDGRDFWAAIDAACRDRRAFFLKVEPDLWESHAQVHTPHEFRRSPQSIQPQRTLLVDLQGEEADILARMKQKTRYNIRLAQKKGVVVRASGDVGAFHRLMQVTGERDQFGVHSLEYYRMAYDLFHPRGQCELLLAEFEGQPLAGLMVFARGRRAWYLHGASSNAHRERMPAYLIQWEAMRWARAQGCQEYDLWGVPDAGEEGLEAAFTSREDGLWGVYRFKRGFGGRLERSDGPWDRVYNPLLYSLYRLWARRRAAGD